MTCQPANVSFGYSLVKIGASVFTKRYLWLAHEVVLATLGDDSMTSDLPLRMEARLDQLSVAITTGKKKQAWYQLKWLRKDLADLLAGRQPR